MPLRPELYNRLKKKFIHVETVHPGEEMFCRYEDGEMKITRSGEVYRVNCPYCPDTRKRLYINHRWGKYDDVLGSRQLWLLHCFNEECFKTYPERKLALYNDLFDPLQDMPAAMDEVLRGEEDYDFSEPAFFPGIITPITKLPLDHAAVLYLRQRGFALDELYAFFKIGFCQNALPNVQMAEGRIFIPVHKAGEFVGWQARVIGEQSSKFIPKYYSMPGWKKGLFIYNHDKAKEFNHVVICEGPTDVWRYGPEAVCLFGKCPSTSQAALLANDWDIHILMLDNDVSEKELTVATTRLDQPHRTKPIKRIVVPLPPGQDPGSMNPDYVRALVSAAAAREGVTLSQR